MSAVSLFRRRTGLVVALAAASTPAVVHAAPATELLYERTLMGEANLRCHLFAPQVAASLTAFTNQARGAAVRAGVAPGVIAGAEARAREKADAVPCASRDLTVAADRLKAAFQGYAQLYRMDFPGQFADWHADRPGGTPLRAPQWRLIQQASTGVRPTLFGLSQGLNGAAGSPVLVVVSPRPETMGASTVRLVMRDPTKDTAPYIDLRRATLAARLPPRARDQMFLASSKAPAPRSLLPQEARGGAVFSFSGEALAAITALDFRDCIAVEFVYTSKEADRVETAWIEAGDFPAARTFLAAAAPRKVLK